MIATSPKVPTVFQLSDYPDSVLIEKTNSLFQTLQSEHYSIKWEITSRSR